MEEALVLTSGKEAAGMGVIDLRTGCSLTSNFKNCIAEAGALCAVGSSTSSYSGYGSSGDYIAVAQAKKPSIHIWQWGKPQVHLQCHVQEIVTALTVDASGAFLLAGTLKGWIYCWEMSTGELINTFQAHFKAINRISVTKIGAPFCISVSEDGTGRAWEMHKILDISEAYKHVGRHSLAPFRTWSAHTLPIKDSFVMDSLTTLRVLTCSLDRTVVLYDVLQSQLCLRVSLPHALESLTCNANQDLVCAGSSNGSVYIIDLTATAIAVTAAHAHVSHHAAHSTATGTEGLPRGTSILEGHTKAVTSLCFSRDNSSLVSASADGTARVWNVWTRQCLKEFTPLGKHGITNAMLIPVPETLSIGVTRPTFCPVQHLNKYFKSQQQPQQQSGAGASVDSAGGNTPAASGTTGDGLPSVVLGPTFLSRHENLLTADRKDVHIVSPAAPAPFQRQRQAVVECEDLGDVTMTAEEDAAQQEAADEEDYLALSGSFEAPKKSKLSNKKRKSLAAAEAAEAQAEVAAAEVAAQAAQAAQREEELQSVSAQLEAALAQVRVLQEQNSLLQQRDHEKEIAQVAHTAVPAVVVAATEAVPSSASKQGKKNKAGEVTSKKMSSTATVAAAEEEVLVVEEEEEVVVAQPAKRSRRASLSAIPSAALAPLISTDAVVTSSRSKIPLPKDGKSAAKSKASVEPAPVAAPAAAPVAGGNSGDADADTDDNTRNNNKLKKAVQFSGQDSVKYVTPHKLPEFKNSIIPVSSIYAKDPAGGSGNSGSSNSKVGNSRVGNSSQDIKSGVGKGKGALKRK